LRFEYVVARILAENGFEIITSNMERFDLVARRDGVVWAIEIKYYRTARAQISLVETAALRLLAFANDRDAHKAMLIVSSVVPPAIRDKLGDNYGLFLVDRSDLVRWAQQAPTLIDELRTVLEGDPSPEDASSGRPPDAARATEMLPTPRTVAPAPTIGAHLCAELHALSCGKKTWRSYEQLCERILQYLFPSDLHGWHRQARTDDGFNRFDFVCRIKSDKAFWRFLIEHLNSRYVVFEFKNYRARIKQGQVLTTEKYLFERGLRRAAIVLTRMGLDKGASAMIQGAMREHGKLILVLDDTQICAMLRMRDRGDDPADLLFDVVDYFLLSLPR